MEKRRKEENRKLTKAELVRKQQFENTKAALTAKGYVAHDLTIGLVYANIMAFVLGIPIILFFAILFFWRNQTVHFSYSITGFLWSLFIFITCIFIHELIHGVFWAIFAKGHWHAISFGFIVQYMTPYCSCREALKKWEYLMGAVMPTVILGILPVLIAVFTGFANLFLLGAVMILCGGGDLAIILKLLCFRKATEDTLYIDHPYQGGLVAFTR